MMISLKISVNRYFNFKRFYWLVRNDILINFRTVMMVLYTVFTVLLLYNFIFPATKYDANFHPTIFLWVLFLGGFWITSLAFKELHFYPRNCMFLMLPSSNFEKFLSKWVLTSLIYVLASVIFYFLFSLIMLAINLILFKRFHPLFNPLDMSMLRAMGVYLVLQSVVLVGSAYFPRHVIIKTVLFITSLIIGLGLFAIIVIIFSSLPYFLHGSFFVSQHSFFNIPFLIFAETIAQVVFWIILSPLCWIITYLRVRESEI